VTLNALRPSSANTWINSRKHWISGDATKAVMFLRYCWSCVCVCVCRSLKEVMTRSQCVNICMYVCTYTHTHTHTCVYRSLTEATTR
jgi:hypothetical protein